MRAAQIALLVLACGMNASGALPDLEAASDLNWNVHSLPPYLCKMQISPLGACPQLHAKFSKRYAHA